MIAAGKATVPMRLFLDEPVGACAGCGIDGPVVSCADGYERCEVCAVIDEFDWRTGKTTKEA